MYAKAREAFLRVLKLHLFFCGHNTDMETLQGVDPLLSCLVPMGMGALGLLLCMRGPSPTVIRSMKVWFCYCLISAVVGAHPSRNVPGFWRKIVSVA
jgi:hypothetical protein